jgi:hypothetical protein
MSRHDTISDSLTADKNLPHGRILAATTDMSPKRHSSMSFLELLLLECRFGEIRVERRLPRDLVRGRAPSSRCR